jgi:hypothetical protein
MFRLVNEPLQLPQGYAENNCFGCDCGYAAITTKTISFVAVRRQSHRGLMQRPELRSGNGNMYQFLAAMPPKTDTCSPWRGAAAPIAVS